jgi:RimJ/RimL family protein N-acetyltransferase
MYNEVLKLAKSEGISQVRLYVDKDNLKAQKVYEKSGMSRCHYLMYEVEVEVEARFGCCACVCGVREGSQVAHIFK